MYIKRFLFVLFAILIPSLLFAQSDEYFQNFNNVEQDFFLFAKKAGVLWGSVENFSIPYIMERMDKKESYKKTTITINGRSYTYEQYLNNYTKFLERQAENYADMSDVADNVDEFNNEDDMSLKEIAEVLKRRSIQGYFAEELDPNPYYRLSNEDKERYYANLIKTIYKDGKLPYIAQEDIKNEMEELLTVVEGGRRRGTWVNFTLLSKEERKRVIDDFFKQAKEQNANIKTISDFVVGLYSLWELYEPVAAHGMNKNELQKKPELTNKYSFTIQELCFLWQPYDTPEHMKAVKKELEHIEKIYDKMSKYAFDANKIYTTVTYRGGVKEINLGMLKDGDTFYNMVVYEYLNDPKYINDILYAFLLSFNYLSSNKFYTMYDFAGVYMETRRSTFVRFKIGSRHEVLFSNMIKKPEYRSALLNRRPDEYYKFLTKMIQKNTKELEQAYWGQDRVLMDIFNLIRERCGIKI